MWDAALEYIKALMSNIADLYCMDHCCADGSEAYPRECIFPRVV